jgi:hypothetical protein
MPKIAGVETSFHVAGIRKEKEIDLNHLIILF